MSVSFDPKALETVAQFGAFVQLLQDPKKLSVTVEEAKGTLASIQEALGNLKTKEQVDTYVDSELDKLDAQKAEFETTKTALKADVESKVKKLTEKSDALDKKVTTLQEQESSLKEFKDQLDARDVLSGKVLADAYEQAKAVDLKMQELQVKETDLNEKLSVVKKMLGEK